MPTVLWPDPRLRLLVAGWLAGFRSPRTRRAYAGDLLVWQQWCDVRSLDPLRARRVQADLYLGDLIDGGAALATAGARQAREDARLHRLRVDKWAHPAGKASVTLELSSTTTRGGPCT